MSRLLAPAILLANGIALSGTLPANAQPAAKPASGHQANTQRPSASDAGGAIHALRCGIRLDKEATLAAAQPGTIETIPVEEGERIEEGDVIARLENDVAEAALAVAQAKAGSDIAIRYAKAAHAVAQTELEKSLQANEINAHNVPAIEIARLRLAAKQAKLQIEKAELDREMARLECQQLQAELERRTIVSPLNGIVVQIFKQPGEAVRQGDPIMHVVNTDLVRVEGFLSVAQATRVRRGDPVRVRIDMRELPGRLQDKTFTGTLMFVDPTVQRVDETIRVWAQVKNPENLLKANMPVTMTILPQGDAKRGAHAVAEQAP